ncbi:MAG: methionyl-tRNA formyltransferase [Thermodesulfobacteriota bacterium]
MGDAKGTASSPREAPFPEGWTMRIILVGQGPFGEKVLDALIKYGEEIVGVFSPPDKRGEAMKNLAERSNIPSYCPKQMKNPEVYEAFKKLNPDLVILAFVTDILPERLLSLPTLGTICYHPSLLPRHRGGSAINWAIIQGDKRTGLTILWSDKGIDTGPILLQKEVEIGPNDTTGSLYFNTLFPMGIEAVIEAVELIKRGKAPRIPQDESKATYEPPCDDRVAWIDFAKPVHDVYNLIRGCDPQPGAYSTFKGKKIRFYDVRMESSESGKKPGEILTIEKEGIQMAVKGGVIRIGKVRVDKGEKMGPLEFAQSAGVKVGDRFGT